MPLRPAASARRWLAGRALACLLACAWLCIPRSAAADEATACAAGNVLDAARLWRWSDTEHTTALLTDGDVVPEGARWPSRSVVFDTTLSSLTFDLGAERPLRAVYFQGDAEVAFALLLSQDGRAWRRVSLDAVPGARGARSRSRSFEPIAARYVRVGEPSAPHAMATELRLYCAPPSAPDVRVLPADPGPESSFAPPTWAERAWFAVAGTPALVEPQANAIKLALALAAMTLLAVGSLGRGRLARTRDALLLVVGVASFSGYYDWGAYRFPNFAHEHELFHYFVAAKYGRELGYGGLYDCAAEADAEDGLRRRAEARQVRDLSNNVVTGGKASLERGEACKRAFSEARWRAFGRDVAYFRDHMAPDAWDHTLRDHGYNASPAWTAIGGALANRGAASARFVAGADSILTGTLGLIDPALVVASFAAIVWAFGWRAACVAAVVFGCNPLASFLWTGGALMRQEWWSLSVAGVCLLKKQRWALGGGGLAAATLLRVFPGGFVLPIALAAAEGAWRTHRIDRRYARVLVGAAVAGALLFTFSSVATGGAHTWGDFARNTAKHTSTPSENLVGLRTLLSFRPSTRAALLYDASLPDPFSAVVEARRANLAAARPIYFVAVLLTGALLVRAARRRGDPWALACLGAAVIPIAVEPSCYYSSFLVLASLLGHERARVPVVLCGACAALGALHMTGDGDVSYAASSAVLVLFAAWLLVEHGSRGAAPRPAAVTALPRWVLAAGAVAALALVVRGRDSVAGLEATCEERWGDLRDALGPQATPPHLHRADLSDRAKVDAFLQARRARGAPADPGAEAARARYDVAAVAFDAALAERGTSLDPESGEPFLPRVVWGPL